MIQLPQQPQSIFTNFLNEYSHSEIKHDFPQHKNNQNQKINSTLTHLNPINSQQTYTYPTFAQPAIQPQSQTLTFNPIYAQPLLNQPPYNSKHIYEPKKSGIVNEIIKSINNQHQKILEAITISEERTSNFNYYHDLILRKCDMMKELEQKYKDHYFDLESKLIKKFKSLDDLSKRVYNIKTYQQAYCDQQNKIQDLVIFIYKYLDGKKKKNHLNNAMRKILGHNSRDLRKYNLLPPTPLTKIFMDLKGKDYITHKSNVLKDQSDPESEESKTIEDKVNNSIPLKSPLKVLEKEKEKDLLLIKSPKSTLKKSLAKEKDLLNASELPKIPAESNVKITEAIIKQNKGFDPIKAPTVIAKTKIKKKRNHKSLKNNNKNNLKKQRGRFKNINKKKIIKKQKKLTNIKDKPPDPIKTTTLESFDPIDPPNKTKSQDLFEPPGPFEVSDPWTIHQSDPWWTHQLSEPEFKEDYEQKKQLQPNLTIKNYFYKYHQFCGPNIKVKY